ncbi:FAD-dependent oxidoreductase [Nocardia sp. NPDC049149]|uniref:FAD-dependent oxidoreductase n=1 Tax=Nocardia sp. NPDC049149 TaxID=3364315 RepID=UPI003723909D
MMPDKRSNTVGATRRSALRAGVIGAGALAAAAVTAGPLMNTRREDSPVAKQEFDVVVVGAGPIGAATARHLTARRASVAVVGPEEPAGIENPGLWAGHYDEGRLAHALEAPLLTGLLATRSMRRFAALVASTGIEFTRPVHSLTVGPRAIESAVAAEWFNLDRLYDNATDLGVEVQRLDEEELAKTYPALHFEPAHVGVVQREAMLVNPRQLVRAELAGAVAGADA